METGAYNIDTRLIYLVDGYYELHFWIPLDELNDFLGLRADAIVRSNN
jgi:hypothetical protein